MALIHTPSQSMIPGDAVAHMAAKAGGTPETSLPPAGEPVARIVSCDWAVLSLCSLAALVVSYSARCKDKTACATAYAHQLWGVLANCLDGTVIIA